MFRRALIVCWAWLACLAITPVMAQDEPPGVLLTQALAVESDALRFPADAAAASITLPDDWSQSRPRYDGSVWYRTRFDLPAGDTGAELLALYIERACTNVEVLLNGERIFSGGRMREPLTRNSSARSWSRCRRRCSRRRATCSTCAWRAPRCGM